MRGLATETTLEDIKDCFARFREEHGGEVTEICLFRENNCDRLRLYGFFTFDSKAAVKKRI